MKGSTEVITEIADIVTDETNNHDGVAKILQKVLNIQ